MDKRTLRKLLSEGPREREKTAAVMLELLKEGYGEPPLVVRTLARRPELLTAQALRILARTRILDPKVVELLAIASAAALRCEYCLRAHMDRAVSLGVGSDEIFEALTIAASIAESSSQAVSFREFLRLEETKGHREERRPTVARRAAAPRRRYADRDQFWAALVGRFQQSAPDARFSKGAGPYGRSIRLGRGRLQLTWAFRRRNNFAVQLVLSGLSASASRDGFLSSLQEDLAAVAGQEARIEAKGGRRTALSLYFPGRVALTEEMEAWGATTMSRVYEALRPIEGRRRRRGRRRQLRSETPEGRLALALLPLVGPGVKAAS